MKRVPWRNAGVVAAAAVLAVAEVVGDEAAVAVIEVAVAAVVEAAGADTKWDKAPALSSNKTSALFIKAQRKPGLSQRKPGGLRYSMPEGLRHCKPGGLRH